MCIELKSVGWVKKGNLETLMLWLVEINQIYNIRFASQSKTFSSNGLESQSFDHFTQTAWAAESLLRSLLFSHIGQQRASSELSTDWEQLHCLLKNGKEMHESHFFVYPVVLSAWFALLSHVVFIWTRENLTEFAKDNQICPLMASSFSYYFLCVAQLVSASCTVGLLTL